MSGNFAIKGGGGGGVGRLMANAILNFHFDFLNPSLTRGPGIGKSEFDSDSEFRIWLGFVEETVDKNC